LLALLDARELQHPNSYNVYNVYNETIDQLEKLGIDKDYIQGWAGGYWVIPSARNSGSPTPIKPVMKMDRGVLQIRP